MRKMLVATLILALIVSAWWFEEKTVGSICDRMIENIEKLQTKEADELDEAINEVEADWEDLEWILEVLTPHENTDEINLDWAGYISRINDKNYTSANHILDRIEQRFEEIRDKTKVNLQNIF